MLKPQTEGASTGGDGTSESTPTQDVPSVVGAQHKEIDPVVTPAISLRRPVQLSAFPEHRPDRPFGPLPTSVVMGTNADLMAAVGPLYLTGPTLDVTYGRGVWWRRWRPDVLTTHDLQLDGVDFRKLPEADGSYHAVVFDPPYIPPGGMSTSTAPAFRAGYGLTQRTDSELADLIADGIAECARVANRFVLVKCGDFVNGATLTLGHVRVIYQGAAAGLMPWDVIIHASGTGPGGHNITTPVRCRRAHSYLIVFTKPGPDGKPWALTPFPKR